MISLQHFSQPKLILEAIGCQIGQAAIYYTDICSICTSGKWSLSLLILLACTPAGPYISGHLMLGHFFGTEWYGFQSFLGWMEILATVGNAIPTSIVILFVVRSLIDTTHSDLIPALHTKLSLIPALYSEILLCKLRISEDCLALE